MRFLGFSKILIERISTNELRESKTGASRFRFIAAMRDFVMGFIERMRRAIVVLYLLQIIQLIALLGLLVWISGEIVY